MWVLIWTTLLFPVTEITGNYTRRGSKGTESPWNIAIDPQTVIVEAGLCAIINCSFTQPNSSTSKVMIWCKSLSGECIPSKKDVFIVHSKNVIRASEDYRDRVALLETNITQNNCSFMINDIKYVDKGNYIFRLYSKETKTTQNFKESQLNISVKALSQKPSLVFHPLTEGQRATLTCTAPGLCSGSPPQITWTWRGTGGNLTEIKDNTTEYRPQNLTSIQTEHSSHLTFTPSAEHHNTNITCRVTFKGNITTEKIVCLNVTYAKKPEIAGKTSVTEGEVLNLTCSSNPPSNSTVTWGKRGSSMLQNGTGAAGLIISDITRGQGGEYTCTVQHLSSTSRASVFVTVFSPSVPPKILSGSGCVVQSGVQTCLCISSGFPLPLIGWLNVEGYSFTTSVLRSSVNSTITLPVEDVVNATVKCVSRNQWGEANMKLDVDWNQETVTAWILSNIKADLKIIVAFLVGASLSAVICSLMRRQCRHRLKSCRPSKGTVETMELVTYTEHQMGTRKTKGNAQISQQNAAEGQENGSALSCEAENVPNQTVYATIDFSLLKKITSEEAIKKTGCTETEYSELKPKKTNRKKEHGGEESAWVVDQEESVIGEDVKTKVSIEEMDEGTSLYSNV